MNHNIVIKKPLLLLSIISNYLTEKGLSSDILYLTLLLPIIFGIISIAHNIIGLELISKYSITTFILGALITNIETMLVLTLVAIALSLLNKLTFDKLNLLSIPKENLNIGIYSIASLLVIFLLNYFNLLANQDINTVIVAIIVSTLGISEYYNLIGQRRYYRKLKLITVNIVYMVILSLYLGANSISINTYSNFKEALIEKPEIIFIFMILNFFAMIYSGLRVSEYFTYKKIYENLEE